jgi:hypothetical protein
MSSEIFLEDMSVSDCKKCGVVAAGHSVQMPFGNYRLLQHQMPIKEWEYYFDSVNNNVIYKWVCQYCNYESLRFGDKNGTEQFWPVARQGLDLNENTPKEIRKDFDEARMVVNHSVRAGNTLLRVCLEGICNWVAKEFLREDGSYPKEKLNRKLEYLSKHCTEIFTKTVRQMSACIKEYGNDSAHAHKEIEDSDTEESFNQLKRFIEAICNKVCAELVSQAELDKMHNKIPEKAQIK